MKDNKTICFVLGGLNVGGAEKVAYSVIKGLVGNGMKVKCITRRSELEDFYSLPDEVDRIVLGGEGESSNKLLGLVKNIFFTFKLRKALNRSGADTVISFLTRLNVYTILANIGLKKRVIISERNDTNRQSHDVPWEWLRKKCYKFADVVTANSEAAIIGMKNYVPQDKLVYIPNSIEIPDLPNTNKSKKKGGRLLNIGRMVEAKNQPWIVEVFSLIYRNHHDWKLTILGDGENRNQIMNTISKFNIENAVSLPGFVKNPEKYYQQSDIFLICSHFEGTPNVLLEAMSYGLPCVVSDALSGAVQLIDDGVSGLVYSAGDTEDLILKLESLIRKPSKRKKIGENARSSLSEFSPDSVIKKWAKIL